MKKIYILITILAISCTPVRKSYYTDDPDNSTNYKVIKKKSESKSKEKTKDNELAQNEEYQPSDDFVDYSDETFIDVYYPDQQMNQNNSQSLNNSKSSNNASNEKSINQKSYYENDPDILVMNEEVYINSDNNNLDIIQNYESALGLFDEGNYTAASEKLKALSETLKENDTLTHETKFYIAECHIAKNEFSQAMEILKKLEKNQNKSSEITQKTLVRLGQIYCVLDMKKESKQYFEKLKKSFPNSIYLKLSQCE